MVIKYNKFFFLLSLFLLNIDNNYVSSMTIESIKEGVREVILSTREGLFAHALKSLIEGVIKELTQGGIKILLTHIESRKLLSSQSVSIDELDTAPFTIYPNDVNQKLNNAVQSFIIDYTTSKPLGNYLFVGPAGTGKTTGATKMIKEIKANLEKYNIPIPIVIDRFSGADITGKGNEFAVMQFITEKQKQWEENSANGILTVLILDEMEVLFPPRGKENSSSKNDLVSTFLAYIGNRKPRFFIIGCTNHEDLMDSAIARRFKTRIEIPLFDIRSGILILKEYIRIHGDTAGLYQVIDVAFELDNLVKLIEQIEGMAPADIDNFVKRATEYASAEDGTLIWPYIELYAQEEIAKKSFFARVLNEENKKKIKSILNLDRQFTRCNFMTELIQYTYIGIDYESFIKNYIINLFYMSEFSVLKSLEAYMLNYSLLSKGYNFSNIIQGIQLKENNYILRRFTTSGFYCNIKNNVPECIANNIKGGVLASEAYLSYSVPERNYLINKIPVIKTLSKEKVDDEAKIKMFKKLGLISLTTNSLSNQKNKDNKQNKTPLVNNKKK